MLVIQSFERRWETDVAKSDAFVEIKELEATILTASSEFWETVDLMQVFHHYTMLLFAFACPLSPHLTASGGIVALIHLLSFWKTVSGLTSFVKPQSWP